MARRITPSLLLTVSIVLGACSSAPTAPSQTQREEDAIDVSLKNAASSAEANHDYNGAVQHLNTLYQRHHGDHDVSVALARNLRYSGQPQTAADVMQSGLGRFPDDADMLIELGKDYLAADRVTLAVKYLDKAKSVAPKRWDAWSALAVAQDTLGASDLAAQNYVQADALSPDNPAILNNMGLSQAIAGHLDQAIATLKHAADLPNAGIQIRQNLALLLALKGKTDQAGQLTDHNLSPDAAKANIELLKALAASRKE